MLADRKRRPEYDDLRVVLVKLTRSMTSECDEPNGFLLCQSRSHIANNSKTIIKRQTLVRIRSSVEIALQINLFSETQRVQCILHSKESLRVAQKVPTCDGGSVKP
jgi:hypothetical protein